MESRKITVVETKRQKKTVLMSAATTLGELKADFAAAGIDYEGMQFFEGTSKVTLINDDSILPHDVPYKGSITNELVFMLTNVNKKIASGAMSRADAYNTIVELNLQATIKNATGKNYTNCSTEVLNDIINNFNTSACAPCPFDTATVLKMLIQYMWDNGYLSSFQYNHLNMGVTPAKTELESSYSDEDIEEMFNNI